MASMSTRTNRSPSCSNTTQMEQRWAIQVPPKTKNGATVNHALINFRPTQGLKFDELTALVPSSTAKPLVASYLFLLRILKLSEIPTI
jgi:hypothetical protein